MKKQAIVKTEGYSVTLRRSSKDGSGNKPQVFTVTYDFAEDEYRKATDKFKEVAANEAAFIGNIRHTAMSSSISITTHHVEGFDRKITMKNY